MAVLGWEGRIFTWFEVSSVNTFGFFFPQSCPLQLTKLNKKLDPEPLIIYEKCWQWVVIRIYMCVYVCNITYNKDI